MSYEFLTALPEFCTPQVLDPVAAQRLLLLQQLHASERVSPAELARRQHQQLAALLVYAAQHSARYRNLLDWRAVQPDNAYALLQTLPPLKRAELQEDAYRVACQPAPAHHGGLHLLQTSGSSGEPVSVQVSDAAMLIRAAVLLRSYLWHLPGFGQRVAHISAKVAKDDTARLGEQSAHWGSPFFPLYRTGDQVGLNIQTDVKRQLAWLQQTQPGVLITYPSNLQNLLAYSSLTGQRPAGLTHVRVNGETVPEGLAQQLQQQWGAHLSGVYSSEEIGVMAVDCPQGPGLHVMAESVLLEVVRDDGSPCAPGETGRVLVTDLHNFATPLIRYEIRDLAEVGAPCPCGRHLPVLRRIQGRFRNMLTLPDGRRYWPKLGLRRFGDVAPIKQFQVVQRNLQQLDVRVATLRPLSGAEQAAVCQAVLQAIGHPFTVSLEVFEGALPLPASGKFEEFISLVT
jgi:phenylacetate-CoA ligase